MYKNQNPFFQILFLSGNSSDSLKKRTYNCSPNLAAYCPERTFTVQPASAVIPNLFRVNLPGPERRHHLGRDALEHIPLSIDRVIDADLVEAEV